MFLICALSLLGCKGRTDKCNGSTIPNSNQPRSVPGNYVSSKLLLGNWWLDTTDPSSAFDIYDDSIYDVEHNLRSKYLLFHDTMVFDFEIGDDEPETSIVRMITPDTLRMMTNHYYQNKRIIRTLFKWNPHD